MFRNSDNVYDVLPPRSHTSIPTAPPPPPPPSSNLAIDRQLASDSVFDEPDYLESTPDQLYDVPRSVKLSQPMPSPCIGQNSNIHQYINAGSKTVIDDCYDSVKADPLKTVSTEDPNIPEHRAPPIPTQHTYVPMDQHHALYTPMKQSSQSLSPKKQTFPEDAYDVTSTAELKQIFEGTVTAGEFRVVGKFSP